MKQAPLVRASLAGILLSSAASAHAPNDPPSVEYQPAECALVGRPIELCATVLDDGDIAKVRAYFRKPGDKEFYAVEMAFGGARFCATLPAVKAGKLKTLEYYIQAIDTEYETKRTSNYQIQIQGEEECAFPAVQKDAKKAAAIVLQATSPRQGTKVPDYLEPAGISVLPAPGTK